MPKKWRTIRLEQELVAVAKRTLERSRCKSLSEFVSEAVRLRLDELKQIHEKTSEKQAEYPLIRERMLYTPDHMWAMVTPEGNVSVGLSEYAQEHLKGIAGMWTHPIGYNVEKGEPFGVVETWMFMFDLCSPVSGKIIKINEALQDEPSIIDRNPYGIIWIVKIEPNNVITLEEDLRDLMRLGQYKTWVCKLGRPRILGI
jgi:glycine cleavage system H protein